MNFVSDILTYFVLKIMKTVPKTVLDGDWDMLISGKRRSKFVNIFAWLTIYIFTLCSLYFFFFQFEQNAFYFNNEITVFKFCLRLFVSFISLIMKIFAAQLLWEQKYNTIKQMKISDFLCAQCGLPAVLEFCCEYVQDF